jgi:hypothetical protein
MAENVSILFKLIDQTAQGFSRFRQNLIETQAQIAKANASANDLARTLKNAFTTSAVALVLRDIVARTIDSERALNQFSATLKATGFSAGLAAFQIQDLVAELSKTTVFDDTDIQKSANALLRFRDIQGDTFKEALRLAPLVATVLGTDLVSAAESLGRALEDPLTGFKALSVIGGKLKQSEIEQIEAFQRVGDSAGAAGVILTKLAGSLGSQDRADNTGLYGATRSVAKAWDDLAKTIGGSAVFQGVAVGGMDALTQSLKGLGLILDKVGESAVKNIPLIRAVVEEQRKLAASARQEKIPEVVEATTPEERAAAGVARDAARKQKEATEAEARRRLQIQANKDQASLAKTQADIELAAVKQQTQQQESLLDDRYSKGLISAKQYYDSLSSLSEKSATADVVSLKKQIDAQQKLLQEARKNKPEDVQGIQNQILTLKAEQERRLNEAAFKGIKNTQAQIDAEQQLADALAEVNAQLLEQEGHLEAAAKIRFDIQNRTLRNQIQSAKGPGSADEKALDLLRQRTSLTGKFAEEQAKIGITQQQLGVEEERIQNSLRVGAIGEFDALRKTEEIRKAAIVRMREELATLEEIATLTNDPSQFRAIEELKHQIEALGETSDLVADKFRTTFKDALTEPLAAFIRGTKSAKDAFRDFVNNIANELSRLAAQNIAQSIFGKGQAGGGVGDIFAGIFGGTSSSGIAGGIGAFLSKLFGSGAGGAGSAAVLGIAKGGVMDQWGHMINLPKYAYGGVSRRPAVFGEKGAEAAVPLPDGRRIPVDLRGGSKPVQISLVQNFNGAADAQEMRRSSQQLTRQLGREIQRAMGRA